MFLSAACLFILTYILAKYQQSQWLLELWRTLNLLVKAVEDPKWGDNF